jgi:hypothetical protein
LDTYYETGGTFRRMWEKNVEARRLGLIPSSARPAVDSEKEAIRMKIYEPLLITGLLQTEDFARYVFSTGTQPDKANELVPIRMERQEVFHKADPPWFFMLTREAVLREIPSDYRTGQCKRLLEVMEYPKVKIQIIPAGAPVYQSSGFQLFSFARAPDVAYVDGAGDNVKILTDPPQVEGVAVLFDVIRSVALSVAESEALVREIMEDT